MVVDVGAVIKVAGGLLAIVIFIWLMANGSKANSDVHKNYDHHYRNGKSSSKTESTDETGGES